MPIVYRKLYPRTHCLSQSLRWGKRCSRNTAFLSGLFVKRHLIWSTRWKLHTLFVLNIWQRCSSFFSFFAFLFAYMSTRRFWFRTSYFALKWFYQTHVFIVCALLVLGEKKAVLWQLISCTSLGGMDVLCKFCTLILLAFCMPTAWSELLRSFGSIAIHWEFRSGLLLEKNIVPHNERNSVSLTEWEKINHVLS